jgi:pimeloyl-ACP methyl ester carboxylesterase
MPFYERGDVRIHYEEAGSGFPLLAMPGGGLNSILSGWPRSPIDAMEAFKDDFRVITMDQRNANGGESTGPIPESKPWDAFADDQLGLMDHLGVNEFMAMGFCIGGPFVMKLAERAPDRVKAVVVANPVGHRVDLPGVMYKSSMENWAPELLKNRPELTMAMVEKYLHQLWKEPEDFLYSVSRDFVRNCKTPILVLPDDTPAHSYAVAIEITEIAPKVEKTIYPYKEMPDKIAEVTAHVMRFLKAHEPVAATR